MNTRRIISILSVLALVLCCAWIGAIAEEAEEPVLVTPKPRELAGLTFIIDGPDPSMPRTFT